MSELLQTLHQFAQTALAIVPVLPNASFAPYVFLAIIASFGVGLVTSGVLFASTIGIIDPTAAREKAENLARKGSFKAAKEAFLSIYSYKRAAEMAFKADSLEEAAELYTKAREFRHAARLYGSLRKHAEAADAYTLASCPNEAGEEWRKAGNIDAALRCFREAGNLSRVELLLTQQGDKSRVGDLYSEAHRKLLLDAGTNPTTDEKQRIHAYAAKAGAAYRAAGELKKAYDVFISTGQILEAAGCMEEGGDLKKASDLYLQAGKPEDSARLLIRLGHFERAADVYEEIGRSSEIPKLLEMAGKKDEAKAYEARLALDSGDQGLAANLFAQAGEFRQAAQLYADIEKSAEAARMYEKCQDLPNAAVHFAKAGHSSEAAPLFARIGRHAEAADHFEKSGDFQNAVLEYERAGRFFDAGRLAEKVGADEKAISYYQRVGVDTQYGIPSTQALGKLLMKKGVTGLAKEKFATASRRLPFGPASLDFYYEYALLLESTGDFKPANQIFEKILTVNFHFKDVVARKKVLEARLRTPMASKPVAPPKASDTLDAMSPPVTTGTFSPQPQMLFAERYFLKRQLGVGAMGMVFEGEDRKLGRHVALKFLPPHIQMNQAVEERVLREARVAAQLAHPNIVTVFDVAKYSGSLFIVMEFIDGKNIAQILEEKERLPLSDAARIIRDVASALEYAHQKQVVHRDIKPANLLKSESSGLIKVADFGVARTISGAMATATQNVGSPLYMAPEQIQGGKYDQRVDLYALGVVFYEILTGRPPFMMGEVAYHHVHTAPKTPSSQCEEIPHELDVMIMKLLEKDPGKRFQSASELHDAISNLGVI